MAIAVMVLESILKLAVGFKRSYALFNLTDTAKQLGAILAHFTTHQRYLTSDVFYGSGKAYHCGGGVVVTAQHSANAGSGNADHGTSSSSDNLDH
jgi:hypothetical protein